MNIKRSFHLLPHLMSFIVLGGVTVGHSADRFWTGGNSTYNTAANWGGALPSSADIAFINNGGVSNLTTGSWQVSAFRIANANGTSGTLTINGAGSLVSNGEFWVGNLNGASGSTNGTLNIGTGGSLTVNNWLAVARFNGSGVMNITGGTLTKLGSGQLTITNGSGTGVVNHSGGNIINTASATWIGEEGSGTATWNASGGNATLAALLIGRNSFSGNATFTISGTANYSTATTILNGKGTANFNGGTYTTSGFSGLAGSKINLNGGTIRAGGGSSNFFGGETPASAIQVQSGGFILDTNGNNVVVTHALSGAGGLTKRGNGLLNLTGNSSYSGDTVVDSGTLRISGSIASPAIRVSGGATLDTNGFYTLGAGKAVGGVGSGVATITHEINTTNSTSTIGIHDNFTGTLALDGGNVGFIGLDALNGATFVFDLNGAAAHDVIQIAGLDIGGVVNIQLYDLGMGSLHAGVVYNLMTGDGEWTNSEATFNFATLPDGFVLDSTFGSGGYLFDEDAHLFSVKFAAVPEPATWCLLILSLTAIGLSRRAGLRRAS